MEKRYLELASQWRRHLHQNPELSFQEHQTSAYIAEQMGRLPHTEIIRLTPTSVVVAFKTGKAGAKIGLRADIDALPIQEERPELSFQSQNAGVMHACGHDGHTAILMAVCAYLSDHFEALSGEIYAIFQHAEEVPPGGAKEMVATGFFDDFDFIYGQHLFSTMPTGVIDIKDGASSANADTYQIRIYGKGGHAGIPHLSIDPILVGAQFLTLLQSVIARRISVNERMVISNTVFQAGNIQNVIPESAFLMGTVRTCNPEMQAFAKAEMEKILKGVCDSAGATYDFDFQLGYPVTWNNPEKTAIVRELAKKRFGGLENHEIVSKPAMMGGEDFSYFALRVPSTFVFIGSQNAENHAPHHHPKFGLDEDSFAIGIQMMIDVVENGERFKG